MYPYNYRSYGNPTVALAIFAFIALSLTILCTIFITPRSRRARLNGFFLWLHHLFNFDSLLIDKILKFLYIFSTFAVFFGGIIFLCCGYNAWICLLIALLGPVAIRLTYEGLMMFVILVRNVAEINKKLGDTRPGRTRESAEAPARPAPRPEPRVCPNCGKRLSASAAFCGNCGQVVNRPTGAPSSTPTEKTF